MTGGVTFDARGKQPEQARTLGAHVREARAKLTGVSGGVSFGRELLAMFVSGHYRTAFALPSLALIIAGYCLTWLPLSTALMWFSMVVVTQGVQLVLCREFNKQDPSEADFAVWGRKFAASEFLMSSNWAALAYLVWAPMAPQEHMLAVGVLLIVAVIRMTIASSYMPIVLAGTIPITLAIVHLSVLEGGTAHYGMAMFAIATELYSLQLARNLNSTARNMIEYRAQKDALIAELEQARVNSDDARQRAEQASAAKSHFLATMSHELRTPLNAILGFSEVMKDEIMGAHSVPAYKEYAYDIHRSGEHLLNLINQVLDHSRVEAGRYQLHETAVTVQHIAVDCKELLSLKAKSGDIELIEQFDSNLGELKADERAIKQIWLNLIANAIKFTPPDGKIVLRVGHTVAGGLFLSVRDTGPGIPEEEIPRVLSSFGQGSLSYDTAQEGAGLGLPIVRGLVELHGGTFSLKSAVGIGTEAVAEFPRSRVIRSAKPQVREEIPRALSA
jgi:two-component system cell cycle sensor histidine kinase PleC